MLVMIVAETCLPEGSDSEARAHETSQAQLDLGEEALGQWKRKLGPDGEAGLGRTQWLSLVSIRFATSC